VRPRSLTATALVDGDDAEAVKVFARLSGVGLAGLERDDLLEGSLVLVFAMSAWLRSARTSVAGACAALLQLRQLLLQASTLDRPSEPVPLLAGEPRTAVLGLATYVHGLICRAGGPDGSSRCSLVEQALNLLD